jgi:hypothetical protein
MTKIAASLSAVVVYRSGRKAQTVTDITIMLGDTIPVAQAIGKSGRYSQAQALTDYKRNPSQYKALEGAAMAKALKAA